MDKDNYSTPIADMYFDMIKDSLSIKSQISILMSFIQSLFKSIKIDGGTYGRVGKLIKVYGSKLVYYSILDCATLEDVDINKLLNYINYNCKRRFESKSNNTPFNDLTEMARNIREQLENL
jgi:hypothetical protein